MKQTILTLSLLLSLAVCVRGETCPAWDSIAVTTSQTGQLVTIQAARDEDRLISLVVKVGTNSMSVPASALRNASDPQLNTLRIGYWRKDLKQFYVLITCGVLNSSPFGKQPKDFTFNFENGAFVGHESSPTPMRTGAPTESAHRD